METAEVLSFANTEIRQASMIALSSKYVVIKKYAIVPALQSLIIPGLGQFYNDQPKKAGAFLGLGAVSGILYGTTLFYSIIQEQKYQSATVEAEQVRKVGEKIAKVNWGALGTAALVWSTAFLDAYIVARRNLKQPDAGPAPAKKASLELRPAVFSVNQSMAVGADFCMSF